VQRNSGVLGTIAQICVGGVWLAVLFSVGLAFGQSLPRFLHQPDEFFPDQAGNEWRYQGRIVEGAVNQIADKTFVNISTVTGKEKIDGVNVTVFHDSNPGNQGPTDSYYLRDAAGIRYYGSKPGTRLEKQLVPYQIIRFPLEIPSSFEQLHRTNLNLGLDLDHDGQAEKVDVFATVTLHGQETITVPAGTYENAVRMESKMKLLVHLSGAGTQVKGFDSMTVWFVKDVGLVKYSERQMIPNPRTGKDRLIEITEELQEATLQGGTQLLSGRKASAHGVLTRHTLDHELMQVPFPSRLGAHP
jgi:hypothetical protein